MDKVHSMSKDEFKKIENNLLDLDSEFRFKCRKCGKCCTHQHTILFNTRDIFMIAKKLEKTPQEVINEYAEVYITQGSYVPVVHMVPRGKQEVCPFLENNRCTIHDSKPTVCALYPPGRVFVGDKLREIREGKVRYILNNVFCDSQKQTHTVREWLERFNISEEDEFFLLWSKTIYELSAALRQMMERGTSEKK